MMTHGGPRRLHGGPDPFTDPLVASQDPLCLSPEDDLRPPMRERTRSRRLGATRARASLPSQGRTRGVLRREESAIPPSVDRSSRCGRTSSPGRPNPFGKQEHRNAKTAPFVASQDPLCLSLRGRELGPGDWAHGPLRGRDSVPGGCELHGPLRFSPHRGE